MLAGIEGIHAWYPPNGSGRFRTNLAVHPDNEVAAILTSSGDYTNSVVPAASEGISGLVPIPSEGSQVGKAVYVAGKSSNAGFISYSFPAAGTYVVALACFFPSNWDGGDITVVAEGYTGASQAALFSALGSTKDQWQRIVVRVTVASGDLAGNLVFRHTKAPSAGRAVYFNANQIEAGAKLGTFFPTATQLLSGRAAFTGAAHESASTLELPAVEVGRLTDDEGNAVWPRYKISRISGLRSQGTAEDNKSAKVGGIGENPERSERRGKSVVYEGFIDAESLKELREAEDTLLEAFADISQVGRMDVYWHELNTEFAAEAPRFYEARCMTCDIPDGQETKGWKRRFVLGLWMYDPRHFDEESEVHTVEVKETNKPIDFT